MNESFINAIRPRVPHISDKYSWNVFKFISKHKGNVDVFATREGIILAKKNSQCTCCIITNGANWRSIRSGKFQEWANMGVKKRNITKTFIKEYLVGGVRWIDRLDLKLRKVSDGSFL